MRLFFAVPVPGTVKKAVTASIASSGLVSAPWRWIKADNFHITLKFLGETDPVLLKPLIAAGHSVAENFSPFETVYSRFGAFPDLKRPRVLFYGMDAGAREMTSLASVVDGAVEYLGFEREKKSFRPHLTIARVKTELDARVKGILRSFADLPDAATGIVDHFLLIRSILRRSGAEYEEIARFDLSPGSGQS
ncbi:MAG: RNA 2',3'-cyclic phosphodiesterase [Candidatus Krumholzibacteria bacterium]|nr:RNA 2',3'-cyclic phosphodiesterase [Candidatus Krumholzibacteria bacterium]